MNPLDALVPDATDLEMSQEVQTSQPDESLVSLDREKASLLNSVGWEQILERLDREIESFRTGKFMGDISKANLADVGQKFVIASEIARICEDIKADVVSAANGVIAHDRATRDT